MIVEKEDRRLESGESVVILRVEGLVKLAESADFFVFAVQMLRAKSIVVDLTKLDYIDSTGLGELVGSCVALTRAGQALALIHESARIDRLLNVAGASQDLRVLTKDEALQYAPRSKEAGERGPDTESSPSAPTRLVTISDKRSTPGSAAPAKQMRAVVFHGDLQQIEYRYFAWRVARRLGLNGWIQNMSDGTLVAHVEGERGAIEEWLSDIRDGPFGFHVTRIEQELMDFTDKLDAFDVRS